MNITYSTVLVALSSLLLVNAAGADERCRDEGYRNTSWHQYPIHQGQVDTDGILSAGEIRNPLINYDKAFRHAERRDDERFNNPYNRDAAEDTREEQRRDFYHSNWYGSRRR